MADRLVEFVKEFLIPGSIPFLLMGLTVGVALLHKRTTARWGRRWLTALVAAYWIASTPLGSRMLAAGLHRGYGSLVQAEQAEGATAVVVLSGGSLTYRARGEEISVLSEPSAFRALEAARVYRLLDSPWVVVSGGIGDPDRQLNPESETMRDELVRAGVPAERILVEPASSDTREQALNLRPLLAEHGIVRFVLVTSPTHVWRALAVFEALGLHPVPSVSAWRSEGLPDRLWQVLPSTSSLFNSQSAMREYLALAYYWSRGWLGSG